jgi:hypothetical protein
MGKPYSKAKEQDFISKALDMEAYDSLRHAKETHLQAAMKDALGLERLSPDYLSVAEILGETLMATSETEALEKTMQRDFKAVLAAIHGADAATIDIKLSVYMSTVQHLARQALRLAAVLAKASGCMAGIEVGRRPDDDDDDEGQVSFDTAGDTDDEEGEDVF